MLLSGNGEKALNNGQVLFLKKSCFYFVLNSSLLTPTLAYS